MEPYNIMYPPGRPLRNPWILISIFINFQVLALNHFHCNDIFLPYSIYCTTVLYFGFNWYDIIHNNIHKYPLNKLRIKDT